jgi:hypothetical protein
MTQHTPGPWIASHRITQDGKGGHQRYHILAGSDRSIEVCSLLGWDEEDDANAQLIAAAPALLAQLEAIITQLDAAGLIVPPNARSAVDMARGRA